MFLKKPVDQYCILEVSVQVEPEMWNRITEYSTLLSEIITYCLGEDPRIGRREQDVINEILQVRPATEIKAISKRSPVQRS